MVVAAVFKIKSVIIAKKMAWAVFRALVMAVMIGNLVIELLVLVMTKVLPRLLVEAVDMVMTMEVVEMGV